MRIGGINVGVDLEFGDKMIKWIISSNNLKNIYFIRNRGLERENLSCLKLE